MPNIPGVSPNQNAARRFARDYVMHQLGHGRLCSVSDGTDTSSRGAPPADDLNETESRGGSEKDRFEKVRLKIESQR